jgi:multiple sugar transport system ATP-binding protein
VARKVPRGEIGARVREAAELVGCGDLLTRRPSELSGGERQRVALARALVRHPDAFLLDEPLSNLDAQLRVRMRAELKLLHQRVGATMLYVTHDQVEALTLGDRLAVLRDGALQQVGTPDEVYRRPANRFVATFIGSPPMNILPAKIDGAGLGTGPFTTSVSRVREISGKRRLELGIRPEHVRVMTHGDGVPLTVEIVEPAGNQTYLYLSAGNDSLVATAGADLRPPVGSTVRVVLDERSAYVFDADSGTTLVCPS